MGYQKRSSSQSIAVPDYIPVFPLPNVILFPEIEIPLYIFEPRYKKMLSDCFGKTKSQFSINHKFMGISLFKKGWEEKKEPVPSYDIIGVGYIRAVFENPDGTSNILIKGIGRAKIVEYVQQEPYRIAKVKSIPDIVDDKKHLTELTIELKKLLLMKLRFASETPQTRFTLPKEFQNPITLSHLAAFFSTANPYLKQDLLETTNCVCRMKHLIDIFNEEIFPHSRQN